MPRPTIFLLNGPNTNLYGLDPSGVYGTESFAAIRQRCLDKGEALGLSVDFRQSNHEGVLVDWIQEARGKAAGIVINGAGYAYTSIAIYDALIAFPGPILEVHMSNTKKREPFRHHSYVALAARGTIAGLGPLGYELALEAMATLVSQGERAR